MKRVACLMVILLFGASYGSTQGIRDLRHEALLNAQKEMRTRNYQQLTEAAAELAKVSKELSDEIEAGSEDVISAQVFDKIETIEKLTKQVKDKAKGW